jgi:hypothetical protein
MNTTEFFYWLQGYFELSGTTEPLTADQAKCITRHTALVREVWARARTVPLPEKLIVIEALATAIVNGADGSAITPQIRASIHEQFEHVIDPAAGGPEQQAKLDAIHSGGKPWRPGEPVYRC